MKKWALVCTGGGAAGCWQVGMAKALWAAGLRPDFMVGTSVGALNVAGLSYSGPTRLETTWTAIKSEDDIFTGHFYVQYPFENGMKSADPLRSTVQVLHDGGMPTIPFYVTGTQMLPLKPKLIVTPHTDADIVDWITTSARIPGYVDPYIKPGFCVCDGGVIANVPVPTAIALGAEVCVVLQCGAQDPDAGDTYAPNGIIGQFMRAFDLIGDALQNYEDQGTQVINVWAPNNSIGVLDFDPVKIASGIAGGFSAGHAMVGVILDALKA
jgi:NTE family protein